MLKFFAEKMCVAFAVQKLLTFFQQKISEILCIESTKTVNEMTLNELVKLTMRWTTGPWCFMFLSTLFKSYWDDTDRAGYYQLIYASKTLFCGCSIHVNGSIFLKNRHFIIQERFNKLIYGIKKIIKCGTWQPVKFQLVSPSWNEMIFYHIA